jgi:hypothetical protein
MCSECNLKLNIVSKDEFVIYCKNCEQMLLHKSGFVPNIKFSIPDICCRICVNKKMENNICALNAK